MGMTFNQRNRTVGVQTNIDGTNINKPSGDFNQAGRNIHNVTDRGKSRGGSGKPSDDSDFTGTSRPSRADE